MIRSAHTLCLSLCVLALSTLSAACSTKSDSDGDGSGGAAAYTFCAPAETCPPSIDGIDLTTPVDFEEDIYNAFLVKSCGGGSGCHRDSIATGLGLGNEENPLSSEEIKTLIAELKGKNSPIAGEPSVVAGDWENSFFMAKIDGCQNEGTFTCNSDADSMVYAVCDTDCGDGMPASEGTSANPVAYSLTKEQRDTVRAWIAQGAPGE